MTTITSIIKNIDKITPIIKNKYVSYDELQLLVNKTELFLKVAKNSMNSMLCDTHYGLDLLFPAMDHLKLFLKESDLGVIALISKTLYNLMVKHFTQCKIDISILQHYISNDSYKYNVDIDFVVQERKFSVPINIKSITHKKLQNLIGRDEYLKLYGKLHYRFSKDDYINMFSKKNQIGLYNNVLCFFCEKPNLYHKEHSHCAFEYHSNAKIKYPDFEKITEIIQYMPVENNICPELEYLAIENLKINMPTKMKFTCKGVYSDDRNNLCSKCGIKKHIHDIYVEKK